MSTPIEVTIKNPCLDSNFLTLSAPALPTKTYTLYDNSYFGTIWSHPAFTIVASPQVLAICGGLSYSSTAGLNGGVLDSYLTYYPTFYQLHIYSENRSLPPNSPYDYEISVSLTQYPSVSTSSTGNIIIIDACATPVSFAAVASAVSITANYGETVSMAVPYLLVNPPTCISDVTYSCTVATTQ